MKEKAGCVVLPPRNHPPENDRKIATVSGASIRRQTVNLRKRRLQGPSFQGALGARWLKLRMKAMSAGSSLPDRCIRDYGSGDHDGQADPLGGADVTIPEVRDGADDQPGLIIRPGKHDQFIFRRFGGTPNDMDVEKFQEFPGGVQKRRRIVIPCRDHHMTVWNRRHTV
jgi:hypothetical protein